MTIAIAFYVAAGIALIFIEQRLARLAGTDAGLLWLCDHVYVPILRTLVVLGFVALAYPGLFGLTTAPPLAAVLGDGRADLAITAAFVASLVLPLLPLTDRLPGTILTAQGILACCLLSAWLGQTLGQAGTRLWAGWFVAVQVVGVLLAGQLAGRVLVHLQIHRSARQHAALIEEGARLTAAAAAIALYGFALGRQFEVFAGR